MRHGPDQPAVGRAISSSPGSARGATGVPSDAAPGRAASWMGTKAGGPVRRRAGAPRPMSAAASCVNFHFQKLSVPLRTPRWRQNAALLSFALSIDDFIITFFNAGSTVTFPLQIFGASRVRIPPQVHVLATLILLVSVGLLIAGSFLDHRRRRAAR
jgi:hypothetical protein